MTEHREPAEMPPAWLVPLLGDGGLVLSPAPVATIRRAAADNPEGLSGPQFVVSGMAIAYFAVVDRSDPNRVLTFHALTASDSDPGRLRWWSFHGGRWVEDAEQTHVAVGPLRWVPESKVKLVVDQLVLVHEMTSTEPTPPATAALQSRLTTALREQSTGHFDLGPAYVQWAGYPQGLLLEVGDSTSDGPLAASWAGHLGWLGWQPPDAMNQNAWFQAEVPDAVDTAVDLIVRTREVISAALAREYENSMTELRPEGLEQDPSAPEASGVIERVARDLDELLEALGYRDVSALEDALYDEFDDPDAQLDLKGGEVFVVAYARIGVRVDFPVTASEFWELVREHYGDVDDLD